MESATSVRRRKKGRSGSIVVEWRVLDTISQPDTLRHGFYGSWPDWPAFFLI